MRSVSKAALATTGKIQLIKNSFRGNGNSLLPSSQSYRETIKGPQYLGCIELQYQRERRFGVFGCKYIIQAKIDSQISEKEKMDVVIYGAGGLARSLLPGIIEKYAGKRIVFTDSNPALWEQEIEGIPIIPVSEIRDMRDSIIVLACVTGYQTVSANLRDIGISEEYVDKSFVEKIYQNTLEVRNSFLKEYSSIVYSKNIPGNCAEGGVFEGYFAKRINSLFPDRKLYLFDTFEGFDTRDLKKEGEYVSSRQNAYKLGNQESIVRSMPNHSRIVIKKGYFPDTAQNLNDRFVFVNLDFDLYEPTKQGLELFWPLMNLGGVILVHDYFPGYTDPKYAFDRVKKAVDEFCYCNGVIPIPIGDRLSVAIVKGAPN